MKKMYLLALLSILSACGAIGVGSNHSTTIYNNSSDTITATATSGVYKIKPETSLNVYSSEEINIKSKNRKCQEPTITRTPNGGAIFLDVIPGFILGIIPLLVDAITNDLYHMPETYYYTCE